MVERRDKRLRVPPPAFAAVAPVIPILAAVALVAVPPGCTGGGSGGSSGPSASSSSPVTLRLADGAEYAAAVGAQKGKAVLVDFWATWCGPCKAQFPDTVELAEKYGPKGLAVISVSLDDPDDRQQALAFLRRSGATFTNLLSRTGASAESFESFGLKGNSIPQYKLYDREGNLHQSFYHSETSQFTHADIERAVQSLLGG